MSDALPLPPRPNLEQYKKLAKDLQEACKSSDAGAIPAWVTRWVETLARLRNEAGAPAPPERERIIDGILRRWAKLKASNDHVATCSLTGAQLFIAREHGFTSWPKFAGHVRELARANSPASAFEAAADAIVTGDSDSLRTLLAAYPELARARSTREHRSTLLHYVSANGIEDYRQKTPRNIVEIVNLLLDSGADVNAESDAYGGGCTTLGLVATSVHPESAGVQMDLLQALLDRGATFHQPSAGGNNHSIVYACIANGQPGAARFLADLGAALDIESAAAIGRLDVLRSYFDETGALRNAQSKQLTSAFFYACGYGQLAAAEFLLDRGVDPASRNEDGQTALHWTNWGPHPNVIRLLIERGAPVDARDDQFHATPLDFALWTWTNALNKDDRERCCEAVALLARAGAKLDPEHWRDPKTGRYALCDKIDADPRMLAALRGELLPPFH